MVNMEMNANSKLELRPLLCRLDAYTRCDGSAILSQGETTATATINGPGEVKLHNLQIDKAHVEVSYRSKSGVPSITDKLREKIIRETCESAISSILYPRSSIFLQIHEIENTCGLVACAVNASCLALLNSGISMHALVAGVHCVLLSDDKLVLDPDQLVSEQSVASLTFVFESIHLNVVAAHTSGRFSIEQYHRAMIKCKHASKIIFDFYRAAMEKFAANTIETKIKTLEVDAMHA